MTTKPIEIMCGPKLDKSFRKMYFFMKNGKKTRVGANTAISMFKNGKAVEVVKL